MFHHQRISLALLVIIIAIVTTTYIRHDAKVNVRGSLADSTSSDASLGTTMGQSMPRDIALYIQPHRDQDATVQVLWAAFRRAIREIGQPLATDGADFNGDEVVNRADLKMMARVMRNMLVCRNRRIDAGEQCDDGNAHGGDGCSNVCGVEDGFSCSGTPSSCAPVARCGDGVLNNGEGCDDANVDQGDGCSETCHTEEGFRCTTVSGQQSNCESYRDIVLHVANLSSESTTAEQQEGILALYMLYISEDQLDPTIYDLNGDQHVDVTDELIVSTILSQLLPTEEASSSSQ